MTYSTRLEEFKELISRIEYLKYTMNSLVYWDKITCMPPDGIEYRSKVMSFMADEQYKLMSGSKFKGHVRYFEGHKKNDEVTNAMIGRIRRNSEFVSQVPEEEYRQYIELIALSEQVWEKARAEKNFSMFAPYLEQIFKTFRQFAEYWGYEKDPYDALLNYYEEGLTVEQMDAMVEEIKPFLIDSLSKIQARREAAGTEAAAVRLLVADERWQKEIWELLLSELGFRFSAGRVDVGAHPTVLANSPSDVRIVNAYSKTDLRAGIFNVLHSGGKGIYQQSISKELLGTFLAEVPSFALEEGIGRFYENIIGRSQGFWCFFYDRIAEIVPELKAYTVQQIYEDVNQAKPSLIRIEADELTYLLHIIIRYELEREIMGGRLKAADLPAAWNEKYEAYLGVRPANDGEGVLQDIHWAAGYVGYFPTYFVSNLAAAQIGASIERDCGSLNDLARSGSFGVIRGWLKENMFQYGAIYPTRQLIQRATGEELNSGYYIDYLRKKYSEVYKLNL